MVRMKDPYTACYLAGRLDDREHDHDDPGAPDLDRLVESVTLGKSLRDVTIDAARQFIAATEGDEKDEWIADNRTAIDESGGDAEKAWKLYTQGRAEALAHQLEEDVLCLIEDTEEDEEEDGEDDEDGESEDADEDADEDEDEDEDEEEDDEGGGRHGTRAH